MKQMDGEQHNLHYKKKDISDGTNPSLTRRISREFNISDEQKFISKMVVGNTD